MELTISDKKQFYKKFKLYMEKYGYLYPDFALEYIFDTFGDDLASNSRTDIMNQIYAEIGLLPDANNIYKRFMTVLNNEHNLGCNILEIGGGFFPIMAKYIDETQQKIGKGSITVYDPRLVTKKLGNIKLIKENFTYFDSMRKYDLIVGIMPCDATELIIKKATDEKKAFFVALCGCTHFSHWHNPFRMPTSEDWCEYICSKAKDMLDEKSELSINYLDLEFDYPYPIISSKHKKQEKRDKQKVMKRAYI